VRRLRNGRIDRDVGIAPNDRPRREFDQLSPIEEFAVSPEQINKDFQCMGMRKVDPPRNKQRFRAFSAACWA
jgi:hypothetical protein